MQKYLEDSEDGKAQGDTPSYLPETWMEWSGVSCCRLPETAETAVVREDRKVVLRRARKNGAACLNAKSL